MTKVQTDSCQTPFIHNPSANISPLPVSPVCGASWSKIDDLCYKLISVTDTDVTEVTQAANEVDYANAKVPQTT